MVFLKCSEGFCAWCNQILIRLEQCILHVDETQTGYTTPGQSALVSNRNVGVVHTPQTKLGLNHKR